MNRNEIILSQLKVKGRGIEIGPSYNPIAPKSAGYNVKVLDHVSREDLLEKYRTHGVDLNSIEDVDYVWRGESYQSLVGEAHSFDWIIASHVVEHTPDFVGFLIDCESILKKDGLLSLAVPDKRFCFDRFRPISGLGQLIDSHLAKRRTHSPGSIAEYFLNVISCGGRISWGQGMKGDIEFIHSLAEASAHMQNAIDGSVGLDIHSWCFVPSSFRLLIRDLNSLGLISFVEESFHTANGGEFYVKLGMGESRGVCSRMDLLRSIERELTEF